MRFTVRFQPVFEIVEEDPRMFSLQGISRWHHSAAADRACVLASLHEAAALPDPVRIAIAVRAPTLASDADFVSFLEWSARAQGVDAQRIVVTVVGCGPLCTQPAFGDAIARLRSSRMELGLAEFGMAYSNVLVALQLAPDYIKVHPSLVAGVDQDASRQEALRAIVKLASAMHARVIAEGISARPELVAVRDAGIDLVQGPLFVPARDSEAFPGDERESAF